MSTNDAESYGYAWAEKNSPSDMPRQEELYFQLVRQYHSFPPQVWNLDGQGRFKENTPENVAFVSVLPSVEFRAKCILWHWTEVDRNQQPKDVTKVFTCSTEDTRIILGKRFAYPAYPEFKLPRMLEGDPLDWGLFGPFIESVNVRMGFVDPNVPALLFQRSPDTDGETGDVSSTVSYGFNGGFFGTDFTAGFSSDYSNTTSMQLSDYRVKSNSDQRYTDHTIELAMLEGGEQYISWKDAPDPIPLPPRATSDMRLGLQGVWELPGDLEDTLDFRIDIDVTFQTLCYRDYASFRQLGLRDPSPEYPGNLHRFNPATKKWGMSGGVADGEIPPNPMGARNWERTIRWSRDIKVPLSQINSPIVEEDN